MARWFSQHELPAEGRELGPLEERGLRRALDAHRDVVRSEGDRGADAAARTRSSSTRRRGLWIVHDRNPRAMTKKVKGFTSAQSWFQDFTACIDGWRRCAQPPDEAGWRRRAIAAAGDAPCGPIASPPALRRADPARRVDGRLRADPDGAGRRRRHPDPAGGAEGGRRQIRAGASASTSRCTCSTLAWLGRLLRRRLRHLLLHQPSRWRRSCSSALGNTLMLALPAAVLGFPLGIMLGALAAFNHGTWLDKLFSATAITGVSLPHYWVGIVLVAIFAVILNVLPAQGMGPGASRRTLGARQASDPAGRHPVADPDGRDQPAGARQRARDPQPGVRRHAARQGPARAGACSCHIMKNAAPSGAGADGPAVRLSARRIDPGRDGVQLAGLRRAA